MAFLSSFLLLLPFLTHGSRRTQPDSFISVPTGQSKGCKAVYTTLSNGLPVLLISDPRTDRAAAAMDVAVGALDDPEDRQGLAHFVEHMVLLGSRKYPEEQDFKHYAQSHGGGRNAFTDQWHSNFFFSVGSSSLEGALDRMAQFFIAPLLSGNTAAKEVEAINNEYEKDLEEDSWAIWELYKHLADQQHPFHKFNTGSKKTLSTPGMLDALMQFHHKYYTSAQTMRLAIFGQQSVKQLHQWASAYFKCIPQNTPPTRTAVRIPVWPHTGILIRMKPISDLRQLRLVWELPPFVGNYTAMVPTLLTYLLERKAKGSLYQSLKAPDLAEDLHLKIEHVRDFTLMELTIALTPAGLAHYSTVVAAVFGYLNLIQRQGLVCSLWQNAWKLQSLGFQYGEMGTVEQFVSNAATGMQYKSPVDTLGNPANYKCNRRLLKDVIERLTPQVMLLFVIAHPTHPLDQVEPIHGTQYAVEELLPLQLEQWANAKHFNGMILPGRNPYFPTHFHLYRPPRVSQVPELLKDETGLIVWQQPSVLFGGPKGVFSCQVQFPQFITNNVAMLTLDLYANVAEDLVESDGYLASELGMELQLTASQSTLTLLISGFSASIPKLLQVLLGAMKGNFKEDRFGVLWATTKETLINKKYSDGFTYAKETLLPYVMESPSFSIRQQLHALNTIDFSHFMQFAKVLKKHKTHIACLGFGNLDEHHVTSMAREVQVALQGIPSPSVPSRKSVLLPKGHDIAIRFPASDPNDVNSVLLSTYQWPTNHSPQEALKMELFQFITEIPAYDKLRTQEQLGYVVNTFTSVSRGIVAYHVLIQSAEFPPEYLDSRVEAFLAGAGEILTSLGEEGVTSIQKELLQSKSHQPLGLQDEFQEVWQQVTRSTKHIRSKAAKVTPSPITKGDIEELLQLGLLSRSERRKASILVYGKDQSMLEASGGSHWAEILDETSIDEWKHQYL